MTERKVMKLDKPSPSEDEDNDDEDDVISCSSGEANFTTLQHGSSVQYRPLSKKKEPARFGVNRKGTSKSGDLTFQDLILKAEMVKKTDKDQKATITQLKQEKAAVLKQLHEFDNAEKEEAQRAEKELRRQRRKEKSAGVKEKSSMAASTSAGASKFVTDSLQVDITSCSEDNAEDTENQTDSTIRPRRNNEGSIVIEPSQIQPTRRKWLRIDSAESSKDGDEHSEATAAVFDAAVFDDEQVLQSSQASTTLAETVRQRDELQDRVDEMVVKLLQVKRVSKVREYSDTITASIRKFREALINAVDEDPDQSPRIQVAKEALIDTCETIHHMGYTFRVGNDVVKRVEKSILSGQVPERLLFMTKDYNSTNDPVQGPYVDVVYEYVMPVVVKRERAEVEDDDLQIVMVAPTDTTRRTNKLSCKKVKQEHSEAESKDRDAEDKLQQQRLEQQQREAEDKLEQQCLEQQRLEQQHLEQQRLEKQQCETKEKLEQQRLEQQQPEAEDKLRLEQQQHEVEEKQRLEQQQCEAEELQQQHLEQQHLKQQHLEQQRLEQQCLEQQRPEQQHLEQQHLEQQQRKAKDKLCLEQQQEEEESENRTKTSDAADDGNSFELEEPHVEDVCEHVTLGFFFL